VKWIKRNLAPPTETLDDLDGLERTLGVIRSEYTPEGLKNTFLDAISAIVGVFRDPSHLVSFEKAAGDDVEKHYYFKAVSEKFITELEKKFNIKAPAVLVFRQWDKDPQIISDKAILADKAKILSAVDTATQPPSDVVSISTVEEFRAAQKSKIPYIVEFYAPWCSYCKEFAPKYEQVAKVYLARDRAVIAKIDSTKFEDIASEQRIEFFPTVKIYKEGMSLFFRGNLLNPEDVVTPWIEGKLNTKVETIEESKVADTVKTVPQAIIARAGGSGVKEFMNFLDRVVFTAPTDLGVYFVNSNVGGSSVELYRNGDLISKYPGSITDGDAFEKWRQRALIPAAWRFTDDIFEAVQTSGMKGIVFLFAPKPLPPPIPSADNATEDEIDAAEEAQETKVENNPLVQVMFKAGSSKKFPDVTFSFGEVKDDGYLLEFFNVKLEETPCLRILDMSNPKRSVSYIVNVPASSLESVDVYASVIKDWEDGKLKAIERGNQGEEEQEQEDDSHEGHDHEHDDEDDDHEHDEL
jgi:thiol-disulfide isomerase/thioredoxin